MAFNISDFFRNNITQNTQSSELSNIARGIVNANNTNVNKTGNVLLQNMLAGDTFTGFVNEIKDGIVTINMNDGSLINAFLAADANIKAGQNVTFIVEENINNKISIKPLLANEQQAVVIDKALEAAKLAPTEDNINIVKELLNLNMSIDAGTVSDLSKYSAKFPDSPINTIANLMRLDMPVTENNIAEFEAYKHFDGQLDNALSQMENSIINDLTKIIEFSEDFQKETPIINTLINTLYANEENSFEIEPSKLKDIFDETSLKELSSELEEVVEDKEFVTNVSEGKATVKDLVNKLLSPETEIKNPENLKKMLKSDKFSSSLHEIIKDTLKLSPKDVAKEEDAINNYYKRIRKNLDNAEKSLKESGLNTETAKNLSDIKSNIDFMNDLNKNMTYFQMPIKFSESEGNGELYVFTNKKNLANKTDNVSAMLHLDMENLGPMDVYVKMASNNVSTNFVLESEELLDFVYANIDKLNARLEALGYSTHFEMKVANQGGNTEFDFVKDFVERDVRPNEAGQFMLDIKA